MTQINDCYSPHTGEHIATATPADWMGRAGTPAPEYDPQTAAAFWRGEADGWEIVPAAEKKDPVPQIVSRLQARVAMHRAGLLSAVEALISGKDADPVLVMAWQDAQTFSRASPLLLQITAALGWTDAQVDELFVAAGAVEI